MSFISVYLKLVIEPCKSIFLDFSVSVTYETGNFF